MAIYYTCIEAGIVRKFPEKVTEKKAIEELEDNRLKVEETGDCFSSINGWIVHSVFFVRGKKVMRIWDSSLNGFRPIKGEIILPKSIKCSC